MQFYCTQQTPLGWMELRATDSALSHAGFIDEPIKSNNTNPLLDIAIAQLSEYFSGQRQTFDVPLQQEGTLFQQKIWQMLQNIPYGTTTSYLQLSKSYGDIKAIRALAAANGKNKLAIFVPCHRVIGGDGSLTGFAWGLHRKGWLLRHEQIIAGKDVQASLF